MAEVIWNCHVSSPHSVLDIPGKDPTVDEFLVEEYCDDDESVTTYPRPIEVEDTGEVQSCATDQAGDEGGGPERTDHSMFDFGELNAAESGGDEHGRSAEPDAAPSESMSAEFGGFMERATDEEIFARGDEIREKYRLMDLERVTGGVERVQVDISEQEAMEIAEESRKR